MKLKALTPAQKIIALDNHRFRALICGRKFGKTTLAVYEMLAKAVAKNDRIIAYVATNFGEARDIAWELLKKIASPVIVGKPNETRLEVEVRTQECGTSLISLRGWESVETMRGKEFDFLALDEIQNYKNFWLYWQEVLRPTLTPRRGEVLFFGTPKGFNHVYDLFNLELSDKDFKSFRFTSYDNPHLPKDEIDTAQKQMTPERFAQEYLAEFKKASGLVFKEFSREKHLYEKLPEGKFDYIAGVDFGYNHPAVVLHIYFSDEKYYIDDEFYKRQRTETQVVEYVAGCKFQSVYPDPENASGIEELRRRSVNVREVSKYKGSVEGGINKIKELFLNNKIFINKRCVNTLYELETYSYSDTDKDAREKPIKANDDAMDALRYVVMMTWGANGGEISTRSDDDRLFDKYKIF